MMLYRITTGAILYSVCFTVGAILYSVSFTVCTILYSVFFTVDTILYSVCFTVDSILYSVCFTVGAILYGLFCILQCYTMCSRGRCSYLHIMFLKIKFNKLIKIVTYRMASEYWKCDTM